MSTILGDIITLGGGSGGSGGGEVWAAISVTYPEGSTCTATNGTDTLTAADTSGQVVFGIPEPASTPETWTVSCTDGTNSAEATASISAYGQNEAVTLVYSDAVLNNNSWATISAIAKQGAGDAFWDVGDCKAITLNGKIGDYLTLSSTTLYVFILDFNHPINKSTADNNIIFGGFKTALTGGVDVALCDSGYGSGKTSGKYFNLNHVQVNTSVYNSNYGGWKGCDFRYDILGATSTAPSPYNSSSKSTSTTGTDATASTISSPVSNTLMAALPSDLRAVLRLWDRYVDFKGNSSKTDANCSTKTVDAISLLAEFEIFGARSYANQYEQNHQKQMAYYSAGNSKIKYKHNATSTACLWWEASANYNAANSFCYVNAGGSAFSDHSRYSRGLAPAFKI